MRFHVVSLPHTQTTAAYPSCAFTQKVVRFCQMMVERGHEVFLYSGEENEAPCTEHIPCIGKDRQAAMANGQHYTTADWNHPFWAGFNASVIGQMHERVQPRDFICLIGGRAHKPIADAFPQHLSVEFGIGYSGTFATYRVFESYAWMHMVYGAEAGDASRKDGGWWDDVIPNQVDPTLFPAGKGEGGYYLYVGRLIDRKGYRIAQEVCEKLGARLLLVGPGEGQGYGEFLGEVRPERRAKLMGGAIAMFAPTLYVEPFGTVTIEAMATGTPVITTDWGAFTETVEHGVDGYRCRTFGEFVDAADNCRSVGLDGQPMLNRRKIRERALARFSMDVVSGYYEHYFARLETLWDKGWYQ